MNLQKAKTLVTGGGVRIGAAIVRALADAGADVAIHCRSSREAAETLAEECRAKGVAAVVVQANLDDAETLPPLVHEAASGLDGLNVLVNSAAVFHKHAFSEITQEALRSEWSTNAVAPILLTRAFTEVAGAGKIVNLLDRRVFGNDPECIPYLLSKKILAEFTKAAALTLAPDFTVNGVAPGAILPPPGRGADYLKDAAGRVPLERQCSPEEVADAALFCLRNDAVTGQIISVDGGQGLL